MHCALVIPACSLHLADSLSLSDAQLCRLAIKSAGCHDLQANAVFRVPFVARCVPNRAEPKFNEAQLEACKET